MIFEKGGIAILDNGLKVAVLDIITYNGENYAYATQISDNITEIENVEYVLKYNLNDNTVERVTDVDFLRKTLGMFFNNL